MKTRRIIVNNDFYNIFQVEPPITEQDVFDAVDKIAGTQVDTLTMEVPSVLSEGAIDADLVKLYDHPEADACIGNLAAFCATGQDPFAMLLQRAHERGLEFLASLRLNDTHYKDHEFHPYVHQFYYDHWEERVGAGGSRGGAEFDYRRSAVRAYFLGRVRDTLARYDVDGFELNFTRNCKFFPLPHPDECAPLLTQFVRDVRKLLDEAGAKRGRRLVLSAMVPYSLHGCRKEGLDLPTWARLGLIDLACFSSPFLAEFGRDLADARLKLPDVQLYGGCDRNLAYSMTQGGAGSRVVPMQTYRAMAMDYWQQGADGIHLFNVMSWTINGARQCAAARRFGGQGETDGAAPLDYDRQLLNELGDPDVLQYLDKLYLVSSGPATPDNPFAGVPFTVPAGGEVTVALRLGDNLPAAVVEGRFDRAYVQTVSRDCSDYNNYTVKLNQTDLSRQNAFVAHANLPDGPLLFPEPGRRGALPDVHFVRRHPVRAVDLHQGVNFITVKSYKTALTITDVELAICYVG